MRIERKNENGIVILEVKGQRIDAGNANILKDTITTATAGGARLIILDLAEVEFVDSTGLGAIISGLKSLGRDGDLVIAGIHDHVSALFKLTRMDKIFRTFTNAEDALQALTARA